jgi:hypothetical protein
MRHRKKLVIGFTLINVATANRVPVLCDNAFIVLADGG